MARLDDLKGDSCEWCGRDLDSLGRFYVRRIYCSRVCSNAAHHKIAKDGRIEDKAKLDRRCIWCEGPIPPHLRIDAKYCCKRCGDHARSPENRDRFPLRCELCGSAFFGGKATQRFCGVPCSDRFVVNRVMEKRHRTCVVCSSPLVVPRSDYRTKTCSMACKEISRQRTLRAQWAAIQCEAIS